MNLRVQQDFDYPLSKNPKSCINRFLPCRILMLCSLQLLIVAQTGTTQSKTSSPDPQPTVEELVSGSPLSYADQLKEILSNKSAVESADQEESSRAFEMMDEFIETFDRHPKTRTKPHTSEHGVAQNKPPAKRWSVRKTLKLEPLAATHPIRHFSAELPTMNPKLAILRDKIRQCLDLYKQPTENVAGRSPWGLMHTIVAFGPETEIISKGRRGSAIGWLTWNGSCRGQRLFGLDGGQLQPQNGPGVQGHPAQFLAILAQSFIHQDSPMQIAGHRFAVSDLIKYEQLTCQSGMELTFKLIAFAYYLDSSDVWRNQRGEVWSMERLIYEEISQPILGATCGGTHRLMGLTCAVQARERDGQPVTGKWLRAKVYIEDYQQYALKLQNSDGSFSTEFFDGRGSSPNPDDRLRTSGHVLEWMVYSLPDNELNGSQMINAVNYLADLLLQDPGYEWEVGPRGHALRALRLYNLRVFERL